MFSVKKGYKIMTKTQALQRLYKALTGEDSRNTSTKVIEDLAVAAEQGEIGGGGGVTVAKMTVDSTDTNLEISDTEFQMMGVWVNDDILLPCVPSMLPPGFWSGYFEEVNLPLNKGKGMFMVSVDSSFTFATEGDVEVAEGEEEGVYVYTGDFTLKITGDK